METSTEHTIFSLQCGELMGNFVTEYVKDYPTNISVSVKLYLQTNELRWRVGYEDEIFLM